MFITHNHSRKKNPSCANVSAGGFSKHILEKRIIFYITTLVEGAF